MKILYNEQNTKIYLAYYNNKWGEALVSFDGTYYWGLRKNGAINIHFPLTLFGSDEIGQDGNPINQPLHVDIVAKRDRVDKDGLEKYYIRDGELWERENWEEEDIDAR